MNQAKNPSTTTDTVTVAENEVKATVPPAVPTAKEAGLTEPKPIQIPTIGQARLNAMKAVEENRKQTIRTIDNALQLKVEPKLDPQLLKCSMVPTLTASGVDFIVWDGKVFPVSTLYAQLARARRLTQEEARRRSSRFVNIVSASTAKPLVKADEAYKKRKEEEFQRFGDEVIGVLEKLQSDGAVEAERKLTQVSIPVEFLLQEETANEIEAMISGITNDGFTAGKITSFVVYAGTGEGIERQLEGFFATAKTAAALHRKHATTTYGILRGERVDLHRLTHAIHQFWPQNRQNSNQRKPKNSKR